jgi:hypothetical protein
MLCEACPSTSAHMDRCVRCKAIGRDHRHILDLRQRGVAWRTCPNQSFSQLTRIVDDWPNIEIRDGVWFQHPVVELDAGVERRGSVSTVKLVSGSRPISM